MEKYTLLQNILLGLTLAAPIGPVNVEIIKRGLKSGFRQALLTGAGAMCADATYLTLIFFGLTSFLNNAFITQFLGIAGSFILIYLGVMSVREYFKKGTASADAPKRIFKRSFVAGYALAISSPMTIVWWTGVFGALMASQGPVKTGVSAFLSCLSILLGCFLWVFFLAAALHWGRKIINEQVTRLISVIAGLFLIGFGIYFLYRTWTALNM
ncbi:MAG: LysE family translocator [Deltaproteobacteria bacterium]